MQSRGYSVLHGFQGSAGQPGLMAKGLRQIGVEAANVIVGPNRYGYGVDFHFPESGRTTMREVLAQICSSFDIIHVHAILPFFVRGDPAFPMGTDLLALKAAGKRVIVHFRGSEIRMASLFQKRSPYNYVEDDPEGLIKKFPEAAQRTYLDMCRSLADAVIVSDPELLTYVPDAQILRRAIDLSQWQRAGCSTNAKPLVVHAPSRRGVKGTSYVLEAVSILRAEGLDFDFQLIEGMPQSAARELYEAADVIVDQLRIGWYGVLAVEGMALGKAVISYIREDLIGTFDGQPPVMVANPETITDQLRDIIQVRSLRAEVAERGYQYCCAVHDSRVVAGESLSLYDSLLEKRSTIDLPAYMSVNGQQDEFLSASLAAAKKLGASKAKAALVARATAASNNRIAEAAPPVPSATNRAAPDARGKINLGSAYRDFGAKKFLAKAAKRLLGLKSSRAKEVS